MRLVEVRDGSQVAEARRVAVALARDNGFGEEDAGRVAIVVTELATNTHKHGGGGELLLGSFDDRTGTGIEVLALDKGRGMGDIAASMRDGHSTAGSAGTGLGAVQRGAHVFDIYSAPGSGTLSYGSAGANSGTAILARMQIGQPGRAAPPMSAIVADYGGICLPMAGEEACGDAWCRHALADGVALMVADGLGHGPSAAEAAHAAVRCFIGAGEELPSATLTTMHAALRPTRGAAVAVARIDRAAGEIVYAGVGNIAGTIVDADGTVRRMVSHNGTVGHNAKRIRDFTYPLGHDPLVILASDGLGTSWKLDQYPGLARHHPTLIAGVLYRDWTRGRDDVTVLVARGGRA